MIIPDTLAQHIVDSAQGIIHCNVNIMDREGFIIGTAQPVRYRTFHKGAYDVIESGAAVEIRREDVSRYPGAREGVNLPIVLEGQVIGVIGVTGDPDSVRGPARLIKMITELILERELSQQELLGRQRLAEQFVEMILEGGERYRRRLDRAAKALGIDLQAPRLTTVADLSALLREFSSGYAASELVLERFTETLLEALASGGCTGPQDVAVILDKRLVILKSMEEDRAGAGGRAFGAQLMKAFDTVAVGKVPCGAGGVATSLDEYPLSYRQARFCLRTLGSKAAFCSIHDSAMCAGYLLEQAMTPAATMALRPRFKALKAALAEKPELGETLTALSANNFESKQTAFALGIHRNTLSYRMASLRNMTGLDPAKRLDDALLLKALLGAVPL
jgi:carbohydrate diacid regulator